MKMLVLLAVAIAAALALRGRLARLFSRATGTRLVRVGGYG